MKKSILSLLALVIALVACEGPAGPPGRDGFDGQGIVTSKVFTVEQRDWEYVDGVAPYFVCYKDFPQLTDDIYEFGAVLGYFILYPNTNDEVQIPMNYSFPDSEAVKPGEWYNWAEYYSFDYMPGSIGFYVHYSDFEDITPPRREFRIVLLY
ncbi:hypothetical protein [Parabacteroides sp. PF5-9]|uniref:hypothetical protein n=1 Tax=Parabacteroides sp. PF5-9 TaxID=1742404 RepID=UPI00247579DB|nr:hypothetical protein [Parabacteroides sp. PF5-9]MDH6358412.1 hypothetical protein [Parabacteroides sp. PF5-9]